MSLVRVREDFEGDLAGRRNRRRQADWDVPLPPKLAYKNPAIHGFMPSYGRRRGRSSRYGRRSRRSTRVNYKEIAAMAKFGGPVYYDKYDRVWKERNTTTTRKDFGLNKRYATEEQAAARYKHGYRGLGDYERGPLGGRFIPFMKRLPWGKIAKVGMAAGRAGLGAYRGLGDYDDGGGAHVSTYGPAVDNQLIAGSGNVPISVNSSNDLTGDITFTHTEFVSNIEVATAGFENRVFPLNPGLEESFPFLSQIARNFTLYDLEGLIFEYRPTSGEFGGGSNALGKVVMATNYDPDDQPFFSSRVMENYDYATSSKPSLTCRHGVETANSQQALNMSYIRTSEISRDKIFTDLGTFQLATEGLPATGLIGELWVTYKCSLSRSRIEPGGSKSAVFGMPGINVAGGSPFNGAVELHNSAQVTINNDDSTIEFPQSAKGKSYIVTVEFIYNKVLGTLSQPNTSWNTTGSRAPLTVSPSVPGPPLVWQSSYASTIDTTLAPGPVHWVTRKAVFFDGALTLNPTVTCSFVSLNAPDLNLTLAYAAILTVRETDSAWAKSLDRSAITV